MANYIAMAHLDREVRGTKLTDRQQKQLDILQTGCFLEEIPGITPVDQQLINAAAKCLANSNVICLTNHEVIANALAYVVMTYSEGAAPM